MALATLAARYPDSRTVDRRERPSGRYRAVHIVVRYRAWPLESQVRTALQDAWAQVFEQFADVFGRDLRYGGGPSTGRSGPQWTLLRWAVRYQLRQLLRLSEEIDRVERVGSPPGRHLELLGSIGKRHDAIVRLRKRQEKRR